MHNPTIRKVEIRDVEFGKSVTIIEPVNLYKCQIGDNCFIGPFVEIQKGVKIGKNTRIQSHAFICEKVTIGDNCFISHGAKFINDTFSMGKPAIGNNKLWKETCIGDGVCIGTNATILPIRIADDVVIGAGAVVTKDIDQPGKYAGNPAKKVGPL